MKWLAANGTGIGLLGPGPDAGIVDYVITAIERRHYVEIAGIALDGLGDGSCSGVDVDGGLDALGRGRGARQRIQTYDALVRLRHDAGCDDRRQ